LSNFISVENLYYAKLTQDDRNGLVYGTPKPIGAAVKISVDPTTANATFYGDGIAQEQAYQVTDAKVAIETEALPIEVIADLLGHTLDGAGGIKYNKNDVAPYVALLYKRKKVNGKYRYSKIYKVKFSDPKDDGETVSNSLKIQDDTLDGTMLPLINNGDWKDSKDEEATGYTDVSMSWFQSVLGTATPLTISSINPSDAATGIATSSAISMVFSTNLNASTINGDNIFVLKASDGTKVATTVTYNDTNETVTINPTSALSSASEYIVTVTKAVQDTAGNTLTDVYLSNFTTA
jgi:phi13 family phage major tail protein